jgi:ribosomal protein S18 acetylase RimI-like enzyme
MARLTKDRSTKPGRADEEGHGRVREALTSIGVHARTANLGRAEQLTDALSQLEAEGLSEAQREAAVRSAHQLAGSAGTFGQEPASRAARWFERFFSDSTPRDDQDLECARRQLQELNRSLGEPPDLG